MAAQCSDRHCWHNKGLYPHNMKLQYRVIVYAYMHYNDGGWDIVYDQMSVDEILDNLFTLRPGGMYDIPCRTMDDVLGEGSLLMVLVALWAERQAKGEKVPF